MGGSKNRISRERESSKFMSPQLRNHPTPLLKRAPQIGRPLGANTFYLREETNKGNFKKASNGEPFQPKS